MGTSRAERLRAELAACADVDELARLVLDALLDLPTATRAGLALVAPGGRQHHFLPSDPDRFRHRPEWCLIDAYDDLPLNDCIRTGHPVRLRDPEELARAYPELARAQAGNGVGGVCAVPLRHGQDRLGGLLAYVGAARRPAAEQDDAVLALAVELAGVVTEALVTVRPLDEWPTDGPAGCLLPPDPTAPSVARHWLTETLGDLQVGAEVLDAALVCTSELVTNVVLHAGRPSVLTVETTETDVVLRLRSRTGRAAPRTFQSVEPDPLSISGRGLELVEALTVASGREEQDGITTAWCRLRR